MSAFDPKRTSGAAVRPGSEIAAPQPELADSSAALAESIPQWVLFKMPTVDPGHPINN
jgi:hypothetical protein